MVRSTIEHARTHDRLVLWFLWFLCSLGLIPLLFLCFPLLFTSAFRFTFLLSFVSHYPAISSSTSFVSCRLGSHESRTHAHTHTHTGIHADTQVGSVLHQFPMHKISPRNSQHAEKLVILCRKTRLWENATTTKVFLPYCLIDSDSLGAVSTQAIRGAV
jgi:hypothetical protein